MLVILIVLRYSPNSFDPNESTLIPKLQVHGDDSVELSHFVCVETTSEAQVQKNFDATDPETVAWNNATVEHRHMDCYQKLSDEGHPITNQLSLTIFRTCRQIYFESKMTHYTNNIFTFNCTDILERFVRNRVQNKQNLSIRSLCLDIGVTHGSCVTAWSNTVDNAVLKHLTSVRHLHLTLGQSYCACSIGTCDYEGSEMTEHQRKLFQKFSKLALKEVTLLIADEILILPVGHHQTWTEYTSLEQQNRWTMKQKQNFSKEVRDALLGRGEVQEETPAMEGAGL